MNIMIFIPNLDYGGVSNYSIRCVEMLKEEYKNVYLVTFNNDRNFKSDDFYLMDKGNFLNNIYNLRKFIKENNIQKVITSIDLAPIIAKISCLGIKVDIFSVFHMRPELYRLNSKSHLKNKIFDLLLKFSFIVSKNIITVSKGLEMEITNKFSRFSNKILTIYNPIIKELKEKEVKYIDIENKEEINILNVGWIYDLKNQMEILEAINLLNNDRIKITFVGGVKDEVYYRKLFKFIEDNNIKNINFTGKVDNSKEYFEKADIYILSSKSEALPTVLIEALENDVPIIANDCKFGPSEILCDGKYGELYKGSSKNLMISIKNIINNEYYNRLRILSNERKKYFSYNEILRLYSNILQ
ncbi:glycosyltransferase [Clostridium perfringens]|nr:glycosyltransferase [Clostridium perfringens]